MKRKRRRKGRRGRTKEEEEEGAGGEGGLKMQRLGVKAMHERDNVLIIPFLHYSVMPPHIPRMHPRRNTSYSDLHKQIGNRNP